MTLSSKLLTFLIVGVMTLTLTGCLQNDQPDTNTVVDAGTATVVDDQQVEMDDNLDMEDSSDADTDTVDMEDDATSMSRAIDTDASTLRRTGRKIGGSHYGTISIDSGSLTYADGMPSSGTFTIDMNTIVIEDTDSEGLANHINSEDFFDVAQYPEARLMIESFTPVEGAENTYVADGTMTIKEISNPISFETVVTDTEAMAEFTVDRTLYDITFRSPSFFDDLKDSAINDIMEFEVDLVVE